MRYEQLRERWNRGPNRTRGGGDNENGDKYSVEEVVQGDKHTPSGCKHRGIVYVDECKIVSSKLPDYTRAASFR